MKKGSNPPPTFEKPPPPPAPPSPGGPSCSDLLYAFVQGAKWWEYEKEGATMWQSDQELAWKTAECRLAAGVLGKPGV